MLGTDIKQSREYGEYLNSKGEPLTTKLKESMYSGAETKMTKVFVLTESADLLDESPYTYSRTSIIGKANKVIRYE